MARSAAIAYFAFAVLSCDGHRDIRLLEPDNSTVIPSFGGASGAGAIDNALAGGGTGSAVALPIPRITFKNLLILKPSAELGADSWQLTEAQIADISSAFRVTFPAAISEFTRGTVVFENDVVVSSSPVTSVGYNDDMVEPENVPGWQELAGPSGTYDCVYVVTARTQAFVYARYDLTPDPIVGWISAGPRGDLTRFGDATSEWLFGWLGAMGPMFYAHRLGLDNVPGINTSAEYGYARTQDGLRNFLAWYRDYLTRQISFEGAMWGLGEPAWSLGTLRDWARAR